MLGSDASEPQECVALGRCAFAETSATASRRVSAPRRTRGRAASIVDEPLVESGRRHRACQLAPLEQGIVLYSLDEGMLPISTVCSVASPWWEAPTTSLPAMVAYVDEEAD